MKSVEDYHKGFLDGMSANHNMPHTLSIMGYTFNQIIELIMQDENKKAKEYDELQVKVVNAMNKSGYSGSIVMAELSRVGLKIVPK